MCCSLCEPKKKSMTSLVIWQGLLLLYVLTWTGSAFNLDANYPKVITYTQHSYFGYSLAFWNGSNGYKVLVGSPKAKSGDLVTGGLFQCEIKTSDCKLINVEHDSRPDYSRSNQWLGVALDVSPINQSLIIVCAHRAKFNVTHGNTSQHMLNGICYQLINLKMQKSIKLLPDQNLLGMFVQYAKRTHILLIGTPGVRTYRGGYIQKTNTFELNPLSVARYSYSGYCVAVLNNKSAIGMPRYKQYGAVYYEDEIIKVESKYSYGSYFGSALAAVDLNSDGKEDLLVGAPYYSEHILEEGRVYIFFFSYSKLKDVPNLILAVPSYRGQFGKAIATGDFNNDGYSDAIVAAPYENDGSGTIYIFSGHRFGLHETFSQKIQGKDLQATNVKSFGISFSRATDIDANGYPDIAVGAYLSDKVFVFFGRPIVKPNGSLKADPKILISCSDCWQGNKHIFTTLQVEMDLRERNPMTFYIHLNMDTNRKFSDKRTFLENDQKEFKDTVEIMQFFRKEFRVIIKNTVDILEPINFTFTYHLKDEGYSPNCSSICPIAKNGSFSTQVKFDIGCGSDETCMTSLKVTLNKNSRKLILGRDQKFVLLAKVENLGENAYAAKARIFFSHFLEFESVNQTFDSNVECHQESNQELSCFLGHPLKEKSSVLFEVIFFIYGMPEESSIHVIMNATTISHVADEYLNNTQTLWANLYFESTFEATGVSIPETDVFKGVSTSKRMTVMHQYKLRNNGPTDAFSVRFFVLIPQAIFQDIPLLIFRRVKMRTEDGKVFNNSCHLKPYTETKEDFKATMQHLRHNGYVFNCSGFKCHNISCELDKLERNGPVIHVQIYFEIHIKLLELFQGRIRRIDIVTTSNLTQEPSYRLNHPHLDHAEAKTTIIINRLPAKLKWWVVICSIAVGLLILLIFSILLWHCGYFKRMRVNKRQIREERAKEERSLLEHDAGRRPSQKIYTRQKISESEEIPEIE